MNTRFENHLIDNRQIRIFLSSTFSDMQKERDALIQTFEMLKVEAAKRNVSLSVVDLRWGVTEEEAKSGKVISVCLNEIENSHPFFIGILGSNYGTAPELSELEKNPELKERYDWIENAISNGMSITEMEIQYGVLCNNDDIDAAFFFKKSNQPDNNKRLTKLKEKVREKYDPNYQNDYATPLELCEKVTAEVRKIINKHFPKKNIVTPLDLERTAQRAYINSRHSYYFERQSYYDIIDSFVYSDEQHLVFTGTSGIGKSALLANWIKKNEKNTDFNLVYHFVGNSFSGNSYENILRHLCDEIYDLYAIEKDEKGEGNIKEEARQLVTKVFYEDKPLVIVIDGINQIVARKDEKLLLWLPAANKNVKFIFSTLSDDETMQTFKRREYRIEIVQPLSKEDRMEWVPEYLLRVGKKLDEEKRQLERIVEDEECENTLVLRTLLDELTCFGVYEKVDERIDYYLSATSIPDFFDRVLERIEEDYSVGQDLVRHALILIAVSERGLSEDEIIAITGFRPFDWHLFYCAFFNHLLMRNGLVNFSHQYVRDAILNRYAIGDVSIAKLYRRKIVNYFFKKNTKDTIQNQRRISELAYQYYQLLDVENLHDTLLSFEAFDYYDNTNLFLLAKYWRLLLSVDKEHYKLDNYLHLPLKDSDISLGRLFNNLGGFVNDFFEKNDIVMECYSLAARIVLTNYGNHHPLLSLIYGNMGGVYRNWGDYDKAIDYSKEALSLKESVLGMGHRSTASLYNNIGVLYFHKCDYNNAFRYLVKAISIEENDPNTDYHTVATSYGNLGLMYKTRDDFDKALECYFKALSINEKQFGNEHPFSAVDYINIGDVYRERDEYVEALSFYDKALSIREKTLGVKHPDTASVYVCIGLTNAQKCEYNIALDYYSKALIVFETHFGTEHPNTASLYSNFGVVYGKQCKYEKALEYHNKALKVRNKIVGGYDDLVSSYNNIGTIYEKIGNYDEALKNHFSALELIERVYGEGHSMTYTSLNNIGVVYKEKGNLELALLYFNRAMKIMKEVSGLETLNTAYLFDNIGSVYYEMGKYTNALEKYGNALIIFERKLGRNHPMMATPCRNIGDIYREQNEYDRAIEYYTKAIVALKNEFDSDNVNIKIDLYDKIGLMYTYKYNFEKALKYYLKALDISKNVFGILHQNVAILYTTIGTMYYYLADKDKSLLDNALAYYNNALAIREGCSDKYDLNVAQLCQNIGIIFCDKEEYDRALDYFLKDYEIQDKLVGTINPETTKLCKNIGILCYQTGKHHNALMFFEKALGFSVSFLGAEHPETNEIREWIDNIKNEIKTDMGQ